MSKGRRQRFALHHFYVMAIALIIIFLVGTLYIIQLKTAETLAGKAISRGTSEVPKYAPISQQGLAITQCQSQIQNCNLATKNELTSLQDQITILNNKLEGSYVKRSNPGGPCSHDGECLSYLQCSNNVCVSKPGGGCFLVGSKALMADNTYKNIEEIEVGDKVMSYDEEKRQNTVSKVSKVYVHDDYSEYFLINDQLKVTKNHPLYINGVWLEAGSAKIGDWLQDIKGNSVRIVSLKEVKESRMKVYNLEVEGTHTYYVEGLLVHNK